MADQKQAIMQALMKAMGSSPSAPATSPRPRLRPKGMSDAGRTISDMDRARAERMMGRIPPVGKGLGGGDMELSPEQIKMLEQMIKQQNRARDAAERKAFPPPSMMNGGGAVSTKPKKKPKKGCVMKGRGGNFKGLK